MRILVLGEQSCFSSALSTAAEKRRIAITPSHSLEALSKLREEQSFDGILLLAEPTPTLLKWLSEQQNNPSFPPTMLWCDPRQAPEAPQAHGILRIVWNNYTWEEVFEQLQQMHHQIHASEIIEIAGLQLDKKEARCWCEDEEITVTDTEFEILWLLAENYKKVISTTRILSTVWGLQHDPQSNRVAVYMKRIRTKLPKKDLIHSVRGVGYVLDDARS